MFRNYLKIVDIENFSTAYLAPVCTCNLLLYDSHML